MFFLMKSINAVRALTPLSHHSVHIVSSAAVQLFQCQASLFGSRLCSLPERGNFSPSNANSGDVNITTCFSFSLLKFETYSLTGKLGSLDERNLAGFAKHAVLWDARKK